MHNLSNISTEAPNEPNADVIGLDEPMKEIRLGAIIAGIFFIGFLGWAAFIPLDSGAIANGVVAVSGSRQAVQHRDGGIVTALEVAEGQTVKKGDILLQISASELIASERGMKSEVYALLARKSRLLAERDGLAVVAQPPEFSDLEGEDLALGQAALRAQRQLFTARRKSIVTERGMLRQRMRQYSQQIGGYGAQITSKKEQSRLIAEELEGLRSLHGRGFVATNRLRAVERAAAQLEGDRGSLQADIARASEAIGEAELQTVALDRQLIEEVNTELDGANIRLDALQPKLSAIREQIGRAMVRAPAGGRVVGLNTFTVGGVVASGDILMEIVPQDRKLVVEAKASPIDADDLRPGLATQVRFSGIQERNLPVLNGKITKVSADTLLDTITGENYFQIEVIVPPQELDKIAQVREGGGISAGMPAEVMVPLRKRSALSYLLEPLTQALWRAGREH
jgi:HlyD family secretion protein